jgi:hypothetical protein
VRSARKDEALSIAKIMIADNEAIDKIERYTGLTHTEIENLRNNN